MSDITTWVDVPIRVPPTSFVISVDGHPKVTLRPGGIVEIEQGASIDDAARAFWRAVELCAPEWVRQVKR